MSQKADIFIVSSEAEIRNDIKKHLSSSNGYRVHSFSTIFEALGYASKISSDLLIFDGLKNEAEELLSRFREANASAGLIFLTDSADDKSTLETLKGTADGCLFKPVRESEVRFEVNRVITLLKQREKTDDSSGQKKFVHLDSKNPQMAELYNAAVSKIAISDSTVLITGESGTGKELMAYWIYVNSLRKESPFVKVSCAVLPEGVLESELFGHERGAFTGAYTKRKGRFELADRGTIFLDEIGDIPPSIQSKFLRVLQEREFQRVGSSQTIKVNVRIITATSRDLRKEVEAGRFREDLFYRLNVINITVPPLRQRREDIPALSKMFVEKFAKATKKDVRSIDDKAVRLLSAYDWPGNVRELENAMEWSVVMASGNIIGVNDLPTNLIQLLGEDVPPEMTLKEAREGFEKDYITDTLSRFGGNVSKTSKYLGLARKNLQEKIRKHDIDANRFR